MVNVCAVFGCLSSSKHDKNRRFFGFPKDIKRCRQWVQATDRPELMDKGVEILHSSYTICDLHFEKSVRLIRKLKRTAVPTLLIKISENENQTQAVQTDVAMFTSEACSQTDPSIPSFTSQATQTTQALTSSIPRMKKLMKDFKAECRKRKILENERDCLVKKARNNSCVSVGASPQLQRLIDIQKKLKPNSRGNRYDNDFKFFALNIYFASPQAYRVLGKIFNLPSERTLRRINIDIDTNMSPKVLKCLETKIKTMKAAQKYCIVSADEFSLTSNLHYQIDKDKIIGFHEIDGVQTTDLAAQACVIMARGIFSDWKQPLGYCFFAQSKNCEELKTWLDGAISQILNIGFNVVAFVTDQSSSFSNLASQLNVSVEHSYFIINEKKIYYIFDVPHLLISLRNILMKYDFEFHDNDGTQLIATWDNIKALYIQDSKRTYRLAPKLTEAHINPNNFQQKNVELATQVFSKSVTSALNCSIELGKLDSKSIGTAKLIELINNTFDILNSSAVNDSYKFKNAFAAKPFQMQVLEQFEQFLCDVTVCDSNDNNKDVTDSIKCLKEFKISLKSIICLADDLKSDNCQNLFTRRLNQDAIEHCLGSIRQQVGNCKAPTPIQFSRAFKKLFMVNMLKHSEYDNCSDDLDKLLMNMDGDFNNCSNNTPNKNVESETKNIIISVGTTDYRLDLPRENAFVYVCAYLLKKCYDMHKCDDMNNYVESANAVRGDDNMYNNQRFSLINPPDSFMNTVKLMDDCFKHFFEQENFGCVGNKLLEEMRKMTFENPCPCFPIEYLKKLFIRFRIYNVIRYNNRYFKVKSLKRKYFSVCNL